MSIKQFQLSELRYMQRKNLHEEARIIGNYYRDIIHSHGIDVNYYKLRSNWPTEFSVDTNGVVDSENVPDYNMQMHAYGEDPDPDFSVSAQMITYMEVESDIFNLNKFGIIPNTDVNFYFDSTEFATALAPKIGRVREYQIKEKNLSLYFKHDELEPFECSATTSDELEQQYRIPLNLHIPELSTTLSTTTDIAEAWLPPEAKTFGDECEIELSVDSNYIANIIFPVNEILYKSFNYEIAGEIKPEDISLKMSIKIWCDGQFLDMKNIKGLILALQLDKVIPKEELETATNINDLVILIRKWYDTKNTYEEKPWLTLRDVIEFLKHKQTYVIVAKMSGTILFRDINEIAKYKQKIVPNVGDVVTIDFPDDNNHERYQITECNDKDLGPNGLNPLLHKYVWKCKARRYVNDGEIFPEQNDADKQLAEKLDLINTAGAKVGENIEKYPDEEDLYYGGYDKAQYLGKDNEKKIPFKDINEYTIEITDSGDAITIFEFANKSRLVTDGYNLAFYQSAKNSNGIFAPTGDIAPIIDKRARSTSRVKQDDNIRFLRSSKTELVFVDVEGTKHLLASANLSDDLSGYTETALYLDSMDKLTVPANGAIDPNSSAKNENFFKFSSTETVLTSTGKDLYCRFKSASGDYINRKLTVSEQHERENMTFEEEYLAFLEKLKLTMKFRNLKTD